MKRRGDPLQRQVGLRADAGRDRAVIRERHFAGEENQIAGATDS